jgi:hypothetical protein
MILMQLDILLLRYARTANDEDKIENALRRSTVISTGPIQKYANNAVLDSYE